MHQEDDLRALAKVMDFMRAISILFVIINIYWFCYAQFREWNMTLEIVDRILLNFNHTTNQNCCFLGSNKYLINIFIQGKRARNTLFECPLGF